MENGEDAVAMEQHQQPNVDGVEQVTGAEEMHSPTKGEQLQLDDSVERKYII